jgi:hypothetical protein
MMKTLGKMDTILKYEIPCEEWEVRSIFLRDTTITFGSSEPGAVP